ncbi:gamma-glutamyltranspeptidase [Viridothelium virens]|uniref:Glutathione hydrolase n=1 Tax=Viridothelium virens TaxID=1048519 RepID=A0A6A6HMS2_VIRVR|nr:gamma-glutamyltranspeptidase [Viridothelium virens]
MALSISHLLSVFFTVQSVAAAPAPAPNSKSSLHAYQRSSNTHGAVASENAQCSQIGADFIQHGGNAVDAMIGTIFCVGVIGMYHSGIGGGGFGVVRATNGSYDFFDFRETAPGAAFQDMYNTNVNLSLYGGLASGVPGELRGTEYLHQKYGKLSWESLLEPSIKLARNGFTVGQDLVNYMASATEGQENFLVNNPTWAIDFAPNGTLLKLGDTITRQRYASTLETIAKNGADAFYEGPIAEATINAVQAANGTMTVEDLKNYSVAVRKPAEIEYRGYKLAAGSAPSGGSVTLATMKIIEGYPTIGEEAYLNLSTHRLDESMRFAYGMRTELGDPYFVPGMQQYEDSMISAKTAAEVRSKISDAHTLNVSAYDPSGLESLETPGTSHIVTADSSGLAVSLTTTINLLFGSQVMIPETGVIMNDEMNDFSIPGSSNAFGYIPSPANYIRPGKRPLSSMSPTIVSFPNGSLYAALGAAGGSRIITSTIQNLWHVLDQNMTMAEALAMPRLHDQLEPNQVNFEYPILQDGKEMFGYDNATVAYMAAKGHNVTWIAPGQSTAQGLRRLGNSTFEAAGEPRQLDSGGITV